MPDFSKDNETTSKFNEAIQQIIRLNLIWQSARGHREKGQYAELRWALDSAEIELSYDTNVRLKKSKSNYVEQLKTVNEQIDKLALTKNRIDIYKKLIEKEVILRSIQEEAGKGGQTKRYDEDDIFD